MWESSPSSEEDQLGNITVPEDTSITPQRYNSIDEVTLVSF